MELWFRAQVRRSRSPAIRGRLTHTSMDGQVRDPACQLYDARKDLQAFCLCRVYVGRPLPWFVARVIADVGLLDPQRNFLLRMGSRTRMRQPFEKNIGAASLHSLAYSTLVDVYSMNRLNYGLFVFGNLSEVFLARVLTLKRLIIR